MSLQYAGGRGGVKPRVRILLAESCPAGNEETRATLVAKFPPEGHAAVFVWRVRGRNGGDAS